MKKDTAYQVADLIRTTLEDLHEGKKKSLPGHLNQMRALCKDLNKRLANDIQDFITQVQFQMDYDFEHLVTEEIRKAADRLVKDLRSSN